MPAAATQSAQRCTLQHLEQRPDVAISATAPPQRPCSQTLLGLLITTRQYYRSGALWRCCRRTQSRCNPAASPRPLAASHAQLQQDPPFRRCPLPCLSLGMQPTLLLCSMDNVSRLQPAWSSANGLLPLAAFLAASAYQGRQALPSLCFCNILRRYVASHTSPRQTNRLFLSNFSLP